ncbi:hypothetical protein SKAU_G00407540 [Synaphobranchus kaupii]|uniref:Nucleoporin NUP42 n=1 Tax=Synaphobranchus kaupii TaxID=118154 RepID=A0A9Q1IC63_SYNKA|nr:hypothetical protein SKAU_G00407540 [Synaphobranchus kaupii]
MTVCSFFLQGRCRYGEKCWNEHPRGGGGGGGGGGGYGSYSRPPAQSSSNRGGGGFGNRVWVNPSQRSSGRDYVQSSAFPKGGGSDWGRGGGEERNFSAQNRYSGLNSNSQGDDNDKHVETICKDMEAWESSGQWPFSCYATTPASISGFTELSPEELRLEYYTSRSNGGLQNYANSVQLLASQWRSRVQELKNLNSTTRAALIAELNNPQSASQGFPSAGSIFGTDFGADGSQAAVSGPTGFGSAPTAASFSFSSGSAPTSASFSFTNPSSTFAAPGGFGVPAPGGFGVPAADFSFSAPGLGVSPETGVGSFGLPVSGAGPAVVGGAVGSAPDKLFTPQGELTSEELKEFAGKRFTLGQVPLRPPPADLLVV